MKQHAIIFLLTLALAVGQAGCGSSSQPPAQPLQPAPGLGIGYVVVSDAPLPSVLAFQVTLTSLTLSDGTRSVSVLAEPTPVEFARLLGVRTLLGLSSVPEGSYSSVTVTLANPVISFLDLSTTPASVSTLAGSLTRSSLTVTLARPLVVTDGGLAGLHLHFRLRDSLQRDAAGELTGVVDPRIDFRALPPDDEEAFIEELRGGLASVNAAGNSFVLQTPRGRQITVRVNDQTRWEEGESLSTLAPPAVMEVSGRLRADGSLLAAEVEVLTRDHFLLAGLVLDPDPPLGPANRVTLLVREEIPDVSGVEVGRPATVEFQDDTRFDIHNLELPLEFLLFNRAALVRGQGVALGGRIDSTTTPETLRIRRVVLHRQGFEGARVPGSVQIVSGNLGGFSLRLEGLMGYLLAEPLRVHTFNRTEFVGLGGLADLEGTDRLALRVVGLLLRHSATGEPVFAARRVERLERPTP